MVRPLLWFLAPGLLFAAVPVDWSAYREAPSLRAAQSGDQVTLNWQGENGQTLRLRLNLADPDKLIAEASAGSRVLLRDAAPSYFVYTGKRRGGWDNFFDTPSSRPHEIRQFSSKLEISGAKVEAIGARLRITISGLTMGIFSGGVAFTVFEGSNLVQQEAVVSTQEPDVAYYYNASLTRCSTLELNRLYWLGADGTFHRHVLTSDVDLDFVPLKVHRRMLVAEGPNGSVAVFPPPHQYFPARDLTINYANLWYRLYRINPDPAAGDWFSFGIRQTADYEQEHWVPLVNAPPGSVQRMSMFWYLSATPAPETFRRVSAYTRDDRFAPVAGRKTFTSHYHLSVTMESRRRQGAPYIPEFVPVFREMGVDIAHIMDFHTDGHPRDTGNVRQDELRDYYAETKRLSTPGLLLIPGEEANAHYEGHWNLFLPRPLTWFLRRGPQERFFDNGVYRVGNAAEMLDMIRREQGLAWQAHPRTKSSSGYPDKTRDTEYYRDPSWLGAGFKAMPSDLSSPRLGERALKLLDDMNNWGLRKFLIGEVDVFKIDRTHELYGHMNINYLKLDRTPAFGDFRAVASALRSGDYFVTTGEILLHNWAIHRGDGEVRGTLDLEWTFPLHSVELVWGDGVRTERVVYPAQTRLYDGPMRRSQSSFTEKCPGVKWARIAVWDAAGNGAFTQPVW